MTDYKHYSQVLECLTTPGSSCNNVTNYDGTWQCILCGREFLPITEADEQLPVEEPE